MHITILSLLGTGVRGLLHHRNGCGGCRHHCENCPLRIPGVVRGTALAKGRSAGRVIYKPPRPAE